MDVVKKENAFVSAYRKFNEFLSEKLGVAGRKAVLSFMALVVVVVIFTVMLGDRFTSPTNIANLLQQIVTYAIIGFGLTFCLICGGTDLSAGASMALSGIIVLSLLNAGVPWYLAFALVIVAGVLVGIVNGFTIEVLGVVPFIATLGTQWVFRGMAGIITNGFPIYTLNIEDPALRTFFESIGSGRISLTPRFAISAAICGIVVTSRLQSAQPTAGTGVELEAIAAAVVGGVSNNGGEGSIVNTIIGALIMGTLKNGLNIAKVNSYYQQVIIGLILVGACALEAYRHRKQG